MNTPDDPVQSGSDRASPDGRSPQGLRRTFVLTDADGTVTRYEHDVAEDRIRVLMMDGRVVEFRSERAKEPPPGDESAHRWKEFTTTYSYAPMTRADSLQCSDHTTVTTYVYDANGKLRRLEGDS